MSLRPILACSGLLAAQAAIYAQAVVPASPAQLSEFQLRSATIQSLDLPTQLGVPFQTFVRVGGAPLALDLTPNSVRAPGFQLLVQGPDGEVYEELAPAPRTYVGQVHGFPESRVAASLHSGGLHAMILLEPESEPWAIQPLEQGQYSGANAAHVVYASEESLSLDASCATVGSSSTPSTPGTAEGFSLGPHKIIEIACDADVEFFELNGSSVAATQADVEAHMNAVQAIYASNAKILYQITSILVRTSNPDPYTTPDPFDLLDEMQGQWNANHGGIQRDVAHLFTGRDLIGSVIGVAQLDVICDLPSAYGLSSAISPLFANNVGLVAHELGHNWGSGHCDGTPGCSIMCSGLGGCNGSLNKFSDFALTEFSETKANAGCLETLGAPSLTTTSPTSMPAFFGGTLIVSGEDFWGVTEVRIGSQSLVFPAFSVLDSNTISIVNPIVEQPGLNSVVVETETGTSNTLFVDFTPVTTSELSANALAIPTIPFTWSFIGTPGDLYTLTVQFFSDETVNVFGFDILVAPLVVTTGTLSGAGTGSMTVVPPVLGLVPMFSQVLMFDLVGNPSSATNIVETLVF